MVPKKKPPKSEGPAERMVIEWVEHKCYCEDREVAEHFREFVYSPMHDGYVFPSGPYRTMTLRTREAVYISRHDVMHPDHGGEPYVFPDCPWCLGVLPRPAPEGKKKRRPSRGGDGGAR